MINLETPLGSTVSLGQVSVCILREFWKKDIECNIFPYPDIRNFDLSAFSNLEEDCKKWIADKIKGGLSTYNSKDPSFALWHIQNRHNRISTTNQSLLTFHECSKLTPEEINILKNQDKIFITSKYSKNIFEQAGILNVVYCPLGFDSLSFKKTNKEYLKNVTVWGLFGKLELTRKKQLKVLKTWVKKYGNNREHVLHVSIFNPFIDIKVQEQLIGQALEGKRYWNVNFLPFTNTNIGFNDILNSINIIIDMSGAESFDLPLFQCLCLGKHALVLKSHVFLDYTNDSIVEYVNPSGMNDAADGMFFAKDAPFNQGQFFDFNENDLLQGFDKVLERYNKNPVNETGEKLKDIYTYENTANIILENIK